MSKHNLHPDSELLDRLRAGLLDDDPAQKAELESHLLRCEHCRRSHDWHGQLQPGLLPLPEPGDRLDRARRQALNLPGRTKLPRLVPVAAAAAIALVAVVLVNPVQQLKAPENQVAKTSPVDVPEVYEELDFYLWLAEHKTPRDSST